MAAGSNLVNLDEIIPGIQGTTLQYKGEKYVIPGDLPSEVVFEFLALYDELLEFQMKTAADVEADKPASVLEIRGGLEKITLKIREKLLEVFQLEQPDMTKLPFGNQGTLAVLGYVFQAAGLGAPAGVDAGPPPKAKSPARAARKRSSTTKSSSTRAAPSRSRKKRVAR